MGAGLGDFGFGFEGGRGEGGQHKLSIFIMYFL